MLAEMKQLKEDNLPKYNRIIEATRRYQEYADNVLKYALGKDLISRESYNKIKDQNQFYAALTRIKEVVPAEELLARMQDSSKLTSVKDVIKKAKGGTDLIQNPYLSLIENTTNIIKEADRNEVMRTFIDPLTDHRFMGEGKPKDFAQIAAQVKEASPLTKVVFVKGEKQYWEFNQDIYPSISQMESASGNILVDFINKTFSALLRFSVTNSGIFAARNLTRDTFSRIILSRSKTKISDAFFTAEEQELFELYGGSQAGHFLLGKNAYKKEMKASMKKLTDKGGFVLLPRKLRWSNYQKLLEKGENFNRMVEFRAAYRSAKNEGMSNHEAGLYGASQARGLMDFAVAGTYMREINKIIPFSNAKVQGIRRGYQSFKENPWRTAYKTALYTVLPSVIFRSLVHLGGDDEEFNEIPDWQKDLFWNFKVPFYDGWVSIPKPFELGLPASMTERAMSMVWGDDKAFDGALMSVAKNTIPVDETAVGGSFRPILEAIMGHDMFRDKDLIPYWEEFKDVEDREGTKYASRVGQVLSKGIGVDPRKIDHVVLGMTSYYGKLFLSLGDIGREDSRFKFDVKRLGFFRGRPISQAKSVVRAFDLSKKEGLDKTEEVKGLKARINVYYDLTDSKEKEKMGSEIYRYAKELANDLEASRKKRKAEKKK